MPQILDEQIPQPFTHPQPMPKVPELDPSVSEVAGAAMRMENDIWNFYDMMTRPRFKDAPNFDLVDELKQRNMLEQGQDYLDVYSPQELDWKIAKVKREHEDRQKLHAAGWLGIGAQVASGAISPTLALPFMTGATGLKAIGLGALSVLGGAGAQEVVLAANQETRTKGEIAFSLAASTILGGLLGGVAHTLSKGQLDRLASDMARVETTEAIRPPVPFTHESAVGADIPQRVEDVGKLKSGMGAGALTRLPIAQNPIIRGLQQWNAPAYMRELGGSAQVRRMTAGFSQDSLTLTGNKDWRAASPGGNVEDLRRTYAIHAYEGHTALERGYTEMILGDTSGPAKLTRARLQAWREGRMPYEEFKKQVMLDLWSNFTREVDPKIRKAAQEIDTRVFKPMYKEGMEVGMFTGEEKVVGDKNYANRVYNDRMINRKKEDFVAILADNYRQRIEAEFTKSTEKFQAKKMRNIQTLEDLQRPLEEAKKLRAEFAQQLSDMEESDQLFEVASADAALKEIAKETRQLQAEQRMLNASRVGTPDEALKRSDRLAEITAALKQKALQESSTREALGEDLVKYQKDVKQIRQRMADLSRAHEVVQEKVAKQLAKIEANEELQINTILRAQKQLNKLEKFLEEGGEKLDEELSKAKTEFAQAAKKFDKLDEELRAAEAEEPELTSTQLEMEGNINKLANRMDKFAEKIEHLDEFDRAAWTAELRQMQRDLAETHAQINAKRAVRNEKLWVRVEKRSPEAQAKQLDEFRSKMAQREASFREAWRKKGAADLDVLAGKANFADIAEENARKVVDKILGTERRLAYSDIIREKRGPELARVLDIASEKIADFLETDAEKAISIYTRTMAGDLSVARVFGTADMAKEFEALTAEEHQVTAALKKAVGKDGKPLYEGKALENEMEKVAKFYRDARKDIEVLLERARGIRGLPKDADAMSYRMAKSVMELNYLRQMGSVLISSVPDIARLVMRHGLSRTMSDAVIPMITDWKTIRMSQREAKLAGTALDQVMHTRMYSIADLFDDAHRGTKLERGLHYASSRYGMLTLMDQWNSGIKQISAGIVNARLLDNIAMLMGDAKASPKQLTKAKEFLARNNIDEDIARTIWGEVTNGKGGGKVNGIWLPNTEDWNVADPAVARARRAYRAALGGEVDATIVTPGFGKYNWSDANVTGRMLSQFKSYGMVSTQKVLMAGLQEHDAAFFTGVAMSVGLGMMSAYLWAVSVGGETYDKMLQWTPERWLDEGISRSGVTGIFDEVQRIGQRVPVLRKYATLSGERTTRREGGDLTDAVLGPSFDMLERAASFIAGVDEPTKSTLHQVRLMMAFQNLWWFRQILSKVEEAAGANLPERREK